MGEVNTIKCVVEFEAALRESEQRLVVMLFSAHWCEFCQMIQLYFDEFAESYPEVAFYEVDINVAKDVVQLCRIEWFPTFQFYRTGAKIFQFKGPNRCLLERMIQKLQGDDSQCSPKLKQANN
ncbi:thioredoxin-like [Hemiscyllium ocellatum]|uniref:thioredoxin-like n=1 Tax=Hemiscyllium ocellatum TaxID=170820 RepID=UPI002966B729|nr:thioredoxin-like [Hemiscyllium ocellatum]